MAGKTRVPKRGEKAEPVEGRPWAFVSSTTGPMGPAYYAQRMQEVQAIVTKQLPAMQQSLQPAVDFLNWQLEQARAHGEPGHLWVGDANHYNALPSTLTRLMVAEQRGRGKDVVEVQEDAGEGRFWQKDYRKVQENGVAGVLKDLSHEVAYHVKSNDKIDPHYVINQTLRAGSLIDVADKKQMIFPDPRPDVKPEWRLNPREDALYNSDTDAHIKTMAITGSECLTIGFSKVIADFSQATKDEINAALKKKQLTIMYGGRLERDKITGDNVTKAYSDIVQSQQLQNPIMLGEYGDAHFISGRLHEVFKGEYFPVIPSGDEKGHAKFFLENPAIHNALPKAAWIEAKQKHL
jgi:hypothetical protein